MQFFLENLKNEQIKDKKKIDLPERGFKPQIPANNLNFHGDEIKSKQASKGL